MNYRPTFGIRNLILENCDDEGQAKKTFEDECAQMSNELESAGATVMELESFGVDGAGYVLGRMWPEWTGPEEPGAPLPSGGADDEGRGLKGKGNEQPKGYPMYWWVPTDRPNLRSGSRKGTNCPKWEV